MDMGMTFDEFTRQFMAKVIQDKVNTDGYHPLVTGKENTPMQYTENFLVVNMKIFTRKNLIFFLFLLKKYIVGMQRQL